MRVRQLIDQFRHRLSIIPGLYVAAAIALSQLSLWVDRQIDPADVPDVLATTVGSARSVFAALAGGLITAITLLLSMTLITVQLASSQFSPRTVRDWIGDRTLQNTVGLALGSAVFSLLALRSTRTFGDGQGAVVPHLTVLAALALGVVSLFALVRSVDHIAHSVRVGSVAERIKDETLEAIEGEASLRAGQAPSGVPAARAARPATTGDAVAGSAPMTIPDGAEAIESGRSGWIQQIDTAALFDALPDGTQAMVVVPIGGFVWQDSPLMYIDPPPPDDHDCRERLHDGFAIGNARTLQQDVAFGLVQLTDIAIRALSPGVNDPGTANEIIVQLGDLLLRLWAQPAPPAELTEGDSKIRLTAATHEEHLERAFDPIRRYGCTDPTVAATLVRTLRTMRSEITRRELVGPTEPIDEMIDDVVGLTQRDQWTQREVDRLEQLGDVEPLTHN